MPATLTVSSTKPILLFEDTTIGPPAERDFRFVLDNLDFRMDAEAAGGGWEEVLSYDQSDNAWHVPDSFLIEDATTPWIDLWVTSAGAAWHTSLSGGYLRFEYISGGTYPCLFVKTTGGVVLQNDGTYQTEFFAHGRLGFKEASTSVDVMQFHFGGVKKAGISNAGRGTFPAVKCGGANTDTPPSDSGRYLGEIRLHYWDDHACIWAWVQTSASTEGWRGVELA